MDTNKSIAAIWSQEFKVHSYEVDICGDVTLEALLGYFQEAAWLHAEQLQFGYDSMKAKNCFWVLSRISIDIFQLPKMNDEIKIITWARGPKSIHALRDFEFLDQTGKKIIGGSSAWLLLDISSRKPKRVEQIFENVPVFPGRKGSSRDADKITTPEIVSTQSERIAAYSDIDMNGHVNNAHYVSWILDTYPLEFHKSHVVKQCIINFRNEVFCDERVSILSDVNISPAIHIVKKPSGTEAFKMSLQWAYRNNE